MGMIGNQTTPGVQFAITNDSYNGDGSTTAFTLSQSVSATTDIEVIVDNVQQSPHDGSYSVSGTALTFSGAPSAGTNNIYVIYHGSKHHTTAQVIPDDGSVHSSKIANLAVTHAKLHTDMDLSTKNVNPITMSTGTNKMQMAIQSNVSNRFALRSTHTADYDNNPFIVYQPSSAGVQNDALVIDEGGRILTTKQPMVRLRLSGHVSPNTTVSSATKITNWQVNENIGNHWDNSNAQWTCPVAGVYEVSAFFIKYPASGNGHVDIYKNGSMVNEVRWRVHEGGSSYHQAGGNTYISCAANDILYWTYFGGAGIHSSNGAWTIRLAG